jgi:predicted small integral membrane protein
MLAVRLMKIAMVASLAVFALLVTFNNLTDYDSNYQFVRHTLSMDTTFPGNALMWRAITSPALWTAGYWAIILTEAATGIVLTIGAWRMLAARHADGARFNASKQCALIGAGLGFLLWFGGFLVVGGEWFVMWQSKVWNGQEAAFRFYMTLLGVLVFVNQSDGDLADRRGRPGRERR